MQTYSKDWKTYNQRLVDRGRIIDIYVSAATLNGRELSEINKGKVGRPYRYSNAVIIAGYSLKCILNKGYRWVNGFVMDVAKYISHIPVPNFRTIWYRIKNMKDCGFNIRKQNYGKLEIVIDSTGIKSVYDGEYRTYRYDKRKNWLKLHIVVERTSGIIMKAKLTKSNVGDIKEFKPLVGRISGVEKVYGDGAYDSNKILQYCAKRGIEPLIPVRINASKAHGTIRSYIVSEQLGLIKRRGHRDAHNRYNEDYRRYHQRLWKRKVGYGRRWMVESVFSSFKRAFGESIFSIKSDMMQKEIAAKVMIYNSSR